MLANPQAFHVELGAPITDRNNIINVRDGESLYQICIKLRRRLSGVPGFQPYLEEMEEREAHGADPVSSLWQCFRSGLPLLTIYNASRPEDGDLRVDTNRPERVGKEAAFLFIKSCMQQLNIPAAETFTVTDLYSDNTTGFVKVTKLVNRVLDSLKENGNLHPSTDSEDSRDGTESTSSSTAQPPKSMTRRQYILRELVETERQYVHHLQNLQALKKELEEVGALTGDAIHNIFLNLNNLLDFAQRFLIRIEQQNELPEEQQNWGELFIHYQGPFRQYEPFIANQRRCESACTQEWDRMVATSRSSLTRQMLANPTILNGFLLKPFQRLTKYPMLLKDLQNQTENPEIKADIGRAVAIIQEVLMQADASIDKETRDDALQDLQDRIDDWKSLQIQNFGELLLLGTFNVMKEGGMRTDEKEYHIYVFSSILIMCKDVNAAKAKNRIGNKPALSLRGRPRMSLKGRIYFTNVTNVSPSSSPGSYLLQISWKGETGVETFAIKFKNDETMQKWHTMIETQRSACILEARQRGTSDTHLQSLAGMNIENPYMNQGDDDDDSNRLSGTTYGGTEGGAYSEFSMSRNASSTSLRSRSATGGSGGSNPFYPPNRMRIPTAEMPGLASLPQLNTRVGLNSPGEFAGNSYFSPVDRDTPPPSATVSARSSSQASYGVYHRSAASLNSNQRSEDVHHRNTAPAMGRNVGPGANPYLVQGRHPGSKATIPSSTIQMVNNAAHPNRMRSTSSPDIHPHTQQARKYNSDHVPTVPPIPAHMAKNMAPPSRSQNSSPIGNGNLSIRTVTPQFGPNGIQRPGMHNHNYTYDVSYGADPRKQGYSQVPGTRNLSPPVSSPSSDGEPTLPSQLKAKVCYEDNYVSMIIPSNIHFRSLTDRIDAKLSRFTSHSIASGSVRLRYKDEDGDFILIDSDEAVHDALLEWRETHLANASNPQSTELLLFAHATGIGEHGG